MLDPEYKELGLTPGVSLDQVKNRFRQLVMIYHPDRNLTGYGTTEKFQRICRAYYKITNYRNSSSNNYSKPNSKQNNNFPQKIISGHSTFERRRTGRTTPSHRRFNWLLDEEYKGTTIFTTA